MTTETIDIETPHGLARAEVRGADEAAGLLVLGHGAGGGTGAPDLQIAARVAAEAGLCVALVEQPYRVAGRRSPAPAGRLDAAWKAVVARLRGDAALIVGGRSSGARVACRTAKDVGAAAVLCLAFPVHPPGRPEKTRLPELDAVEVPVLVVQGARDPFGMPPERAGRKVVVVDGAHSLATDREAIAVAISEWLAELPARILRERAPRL